MITMEWIHTLSIIGTVMVTILASVYYIHRDVKAELSLMTTRIETQASRTDKLYEGFQKALDAQCQRTDKLYESFQNALEEQIHRTDKLYQMFIDVVKEKKQ